MLSVFKLEYTQKDSISLTLAILQGPETCSNALSHLGQAIKKERLGHWK